MIHVLGDMGTRLSGYALVMSLDFGLTLILMTA